MARSLDQIIAELDPAYTPSRDLVQNQLNGLEPAQQAQEAGLAAQKDKGFADITSGAQSRGLGFSGIPLSEQATYLSSNYLPALSNLKQGFLQQKTSLAGTLADINKEQRLRAQDVQQGEITREQAAAEAAAARAAASAASGANSDWLSALTGGGDQTAPPADAYGNVDRAGAMNAVTSLLQSKNVALINSTYNAIKKSAQNGNVYDKYKLELFNAAQTPANNAAFNPAYANLIKQALAYKAPAAKPAPKPASVGTVLRSTSPVNLFANPLAMRR